MWDFCRDRGGGTFRSANSAAAVSIYVYTVHTFNYTPSLPPGATCFSFFFLSFYSSSPPPHRCPSSLWEYIYTHICFGLFFSFLFLFPGFSKASDLMPPSPPLFLPPPSPLSHWDFSFLFFVSGVFPKQMI